MDHGLQFLHLVEVLPVPLEPFIVHFARGRSSGGAVGGGGGGGVRVKVRWGDSIKTHKHMEAVSISVGAGSSRRVSPSPDPPLCSCSFSFSAFLRPTEGSAFPLRVPHRSSFPAEGCHDGIEITNKNKRFRLWFDFFLNVVIIRTRSSAGFFESKN